VVEVPEGAAGSAHRPLLASTGSELVVLAAADGALALWDAATCQSRGVLGAHSAYVTSLAASGHLVASTCSGEMRLWDVQQQVCLFQVPVGLPLPSPGA
jgi:WD40 repeat protein